MAKRSDFPRRANEIFRENSMAYEECAAKGMTQAETARKRGVSREAVRLYANRHGLQFSDGKVSKHLNLIEECAAQGMTVTEAAKALGVSYSVIHRNAKKFGLKFKPGRRGLGPDLDKAKKYADCAARGLSQSETSKILGVLPSTVSGYAKRRGLSFRDGRSAGPQP